MYRLALFCTLLVGPALAQEVAAPEGVSREAGLAAWARIHEVVSHPRCANCHVGEAGIPMWSGPLYGPARPHGMNVAAGESRMGAEFLPCESCHAWREEGTAEAPHMAPQAAATWMLPPVEAAWFGRSSAEICAQLADPERNGGRDAEALADHILHDALVLWGWSPGGGRAPVPGSPQAHAEDIRIWGAAGFPCTDG